MEREPTIDVGHGRNVALPFDRALERTESALQQEGFGILTCIDIQATMKQKLDVDMERYLILGACAPPLAHKALNAAPEIGLMLPCNVVVRELGKGETRVEVINALAMAEMLPVAEVAGVAAEVNRRLRRVLEAVAPESTDARR